MMDLPLLVNRDVGDVAHLDARAATRCPMRIHLQIQPPGAMIATPLPEVLRLRLEEGRTFEDAVLGRLAAGPTTPVDASGSIAGTLAAMAAGAPIIIGAHLRDDVGRRVGRPDLLVALPDRRSNAGPPGSTTGESTLQDSADREPAIQYMPVDIKAHLVVSSRPGGTLGPLRAIDPLDLVGVAPADVVPAEDRWSRRNPKDQMQLAHYVRLLQGAGHAPSEGSAWAGILGSDFVVALHDLHTRSWASWRNVTGKWSTLERYDHEFGFRLDVAAVALARRGGSGEDPLVVPSHSTECGTCQFHDHCLPRMHAVDEVTLVPGIDWDTRHRLARDHGVCSGADLAAMSPDDAPTKAIATAIDRARVRQAGGQPHRARGVEDLDLRRADVEVDVDMESSADSRVYLWGCLVSQQGADPTYVPFSDFADPLDDATLFRSFWDWLQGLRQQTIAGGRTFAAYCWAAGGAEDRYLRMYGPQVGVDVEPFIASDDWVDLHRVAKDHLETGGSFGLKTIARSVGFDWRDDDPGGGQSMVWYDQARSGDTTMADRLLRYNADDVAATLAVRDWLGEAWPTMPAVDDLAGA